MIRSRLVVLNQERGQGRYQKQYLQHQKEEELLKELITDGVTVEIRQVPSDSVIYAKDVL